MALFMDFHKDMKGVTLKDLKMAHKADEDVQGQYGVKYCQFWVNENTGNVFCLIEAPDIESCIKVHREAHPDYMACAIIEVDQEFVDMTMGKNLKQDGGIVQQDDGRIDLGYRSILMVDVNGKATGEKDALKTQSATVCIRDLVTKKGGRLLEVANDDVTTSMFSTVADAAQCAVAIQELVLTKMKERNQEWNIECKIGLASGQLITENKDYFEDTLRLARMLTSVGEPGRVNISSLANELYNVEELCNMENSSFLVFRQSDENFLLKLHEAIQLNLAEEDFNIERLCIDLGISRPQLYRKVTSLTGKSANELIRDIRMQQAFSMIHKQDSNIAEIALRVGISNPSYFAKCFQDKYGVAPSKLCL
jgi:AraC-like DNA-binding protein